MELDLNLVLRGLVFMAAVWGLAICVHALLARVPKHSKPEHD